MLWCGCASRDATHISSAVVRQGVGFKWLLVRIR